MFYNIFFIRREITGKSCIFGKKNKELSHYSFVKAQLLDYV